MDHSNTILQQSSQDYQIVESAIHYLEANYRQQPDLETIAAHVNLSKYHFQRLFSRWAGISPHKFLQFLTLQHAHNLLAQQSSLLQAAQTLGLSSTSRLYDLFVNFDALTPGEYKQQGAGLEIRYGFAPSPFGECLIASTTRGICHLAFVVGEREEAVQNLKANWQYSSYTHDDSEAVRLATAIFTPQSGEAPRQFHLLLKGTNFQVKVWEALTRLKPGELASYQQVAEAIGSPRAARAVGNALAHNTIAYLIPCHRVINSLGQAANYRWGSTRKKALIGWEAAQRQEDRTA